MLNVALSGTLSKETIQSKEQALLLTKRIITKTLQNDTNQLNSLPDIDSMKTEANTIRRQLMESFSSTEHIQGMTFEDKRNLLHWLFDGKDQKGTPYGIYINKTGKRGKGTKIDYFMYGKIQGLRTIKGDHINYMEEEDNNILPLPVASLKRVEKSRIKIT